MTLQAVNTTAGRLRSTLFKKTRAGTGASDLETWKIRWSLSGSSANFSVHLSLCAAKLKCDVAALRSAYGLSISRGKRPL